MHRLSRTTLFLLFACLSLACSASGGGGDGAIYFESELPLLPGFEKDTGYLPAGSPVQVRAVARAEGAIYAGAEAVSDDAGLTPTAGSGTFEVSAAFTFEIFANIDVSGVKYEGLVESIEYAIPVAATSFDPFLLDGTATVMTELPPAELAQLPLASVPGGTLVLSIESGALASTFSGVCATARDGVAQYTGKVVTTGQVMLAALVRFEVPLVGTKELGPFAVPVDIPAIEVAMDLGARDSSGNVIDGPGPCVGGGDDGDGGDSGGDDGDGGDAGGDDGDGGDAGGDDGDGGDSGGDDGDGGDSGGDDGDNGGGGDGGDSGGDPDAENCGLPLSLGDRGVYTTGTATHPDPVISGWVRFGAQIGGTATLSAIVFDFIEGSGAFQNGFGPGIYSIAGDDTDLTLCGNCIWVGADIDDDGVPAHYLVAETGTVTIAEIDPTPGTGRVAATFSNISLREVTFGGAGQQLEVPGGCTTQLESFSLDVPVAAE